MVRQVVRLPSGAQGKHRFRAACLLVRDHRYKLTFALALVLYVAWLPFFLITNWPSGWSTSASFPSWPSSQSLAESLEPANPGLCLQPLGFLASAKRSGGSVALASYPGSGNTWIRHVIQQGTRLYAGSMYRDNSLLKQFPAEKVIDDSVAVVKTHFPCKKCWKRRFRWVVPAQTGPVLRLYGSVYLLRSPFDAILAEFNRKSSSAGAMRSEASGRKTSHTGVVSEDAFQGEQWATFVEERTQSWLENAAFYLDHRAAPASDSSSDALFDIDPLLEDRRWMTASGVPTVLVFFERFVTHFDEEMAVLLAALQAWHAPGTIPPTRQALACIARNKEGSFKRPKKKRINPFSTEQRETVCAAVEAMWRPTLWGPCNGMLQVERDA